MDACKIKAFNTETNKLKYEMDKKSISIKALSSKMGKPENEISEWFNHEIIVLCFDEILDLERILQIGTAQLISPDKW